MSPALAQMHLATRDVPTHGRDVRDPNRHGTKVASLIAQASGDARLMIIRAGSSSGAFSVPGLSPRQVVRILQKTASAGVLRTKELGFGVIDAAAAVAVARSLR
jgi:subtilisin family serine protease